MVLLHFCFSHYGKRKRFPHSVPWSCGLCGQGKQPIGTGSSETGSHPASHHVFLRPNTDLRAQLGVIHNIMCNSSCASFVDTAKHGVPSKEIGSWIFRMFLCMNIFTACFASGPVMTKLQNNLRFIV